MMKIPPIAGLVLAVLMLGTSESTKNKPDTAHPVTGVPVAQEECKSMPLKKASNIPDINTAFKTWMPYTAITNKSSLQYKLQQDAYTDEDGLRLYDGKYMIAVGTVYANVGDCVTVTLDTGFQFDCVVGDSKGDRAYHGVYNNLDEMISANVVEFIVDRNKLNHSAKVSGDVSSIDKFQGEVISIEKL